MWLLLHQQCRSELAYFSIWSFRQFHLRLLSIPVCLSKDVTGALVCSRGLSSSSFIIVRFIVLSMPGPYLFRPLKQLVATLICSRCECQLRCNRSGSMGYLCTGMVNVLSSRELRLRLSELMEPYFLYTKKKLRAASRRALAPLSLVRLSVLRLASGFVAFAF